MQRLGTTTATVQRKILSMLVLSIVKTDTRVHQTNAHTLATISVDCCCPSYLGHSKWKTCSWQQRASPYCQGNKKSTLWAPSFLSLTEPGCGKSVPRLHPIRTARPLPSSNHNTSVESSVTSQSASLILSERIAPLNTSR